jgi:hypothetical protein
LLLLLYLSLTTDYRHTPTKTSFSAGWRASGSSHVFSGVFITEKVDKSRRQGSDDTTMVDAFFNMPQNYSCFTNEAFFS